MKCRYCGKPAGFLSSAHKECKEKHTRARNNIRLSIIQHLRNASGTYHSICKEAEEQCTNGYVEQKELDQIIIDALNQYLQKGECSYSFIESFIDSLPTAIQKNIRANASYKKLWGDILDEQFSASKALSSYSLTCSSQDTDTILNEQQQDIIARINKSGIDSLSQNLQKVSLKYISSTIDHALADGLIDNNEEEFILKLSKELALFNTPFFMQSDTYLRLVKALVLRDLSEGNRVERVTFNNLPIMLAKNEFLIWAFTSVNGFEEKTKRTYVGGSRGVSVRVSKGVYYRIGNSKGEAIEQQYQSPLGIGTLFITNKNITFVGTKSIKIPINKILSFNEYSDGIGLVKEAVNPHPYTFANCDAWFIINAIQLLY